MSRAVRALFALGLVGFVSACGGNQTEEVTYEVVQPVVAEPVYSKVN